MKRRRRGAGHGGSCCCRGALECEYDSIDAGGSEHPFGHPMHGFGMGHRFAGLSADQRIGRERITTRTKVFL